jgi:iron(III) transport system substrate-binding protein
MLVSRGLLAGAIAAGAFGFIVDGASAQSADALYQAAKKEGHVVWYTTFPLDEAAPLGQAFTKKYPGVKVDIVRGSGTRTVERFETEYRANRPTADVVAGSLLDPDLQWKKDGWLMDYKAPEGAAIPAKYKDDGYWYIEGVTISCMLFNSSKLKKADMPNSPMGLLDPKWKGRVGSIPAWATGTALEFAYFVDYILDGKGAYEKGLKKLDPPMQSAQAKLVQQVIRGDIDVALPIADYNLYRFQKKGAPVDCVYPKSPKGVPTNVRPIAIPKNAPHPAAAKLFLNWRLSKDGQTLMQNGLGMRSVRTDMDPPKGLPPTAEVGILILDPKEVNAKRPEIVKRWQALFGK